MATRSPIVLADAASTPVSHTFNPTADAKDGISYYFDRNGGVSAGYGVITIQVVTPPPAAASVKSKYVGERLNKVVLKVMVPTLETISNNAAGYLPAPRPAYTCQAKVEFLLPERSSLRERQDVLKFCKNLLADVQVVNAVENSEGPY